MMRILKTTDLKKYYGSGDAMVRALDGVNLSVEEGEFAAIVGTSGSGKSTLLHMMGGLDRPTSGSVEVAGQKIFELTDDALTIFRRRKIGFVFQSFNLVPVLNVYENIVLPIELDGGRIDTAHVDRIIETLGLSEKIHNLPGQLSGDSNSAWQSREHWRPNRRFFWQTSRPETWTAKPVWMCWGCSRSADKNSARPSL